jgi:tRNA dimethylallyltransferase
VTGTSTQALPEAVLVVVGATAAGKSDLAVELAVRLDAEIVGADSRQVYRHMDVGTAKPSAAQRAAVPHHMIDVVDPDQPLDAATWRNGALAALAQVRARGKRAIVCGGTGLYIRSLVRGLFAGPAADRELRARFEREEALAPGTLYARLGRLDPAAAARIHANDRVRIVRALEVLERTGRRLSDWHQDHRLADPSFATLTIEVRRDRSELHQRIAARSAAMVAGGLVEEVATLRARGYAAGLPALSAIGYREAGECLDGRLAPAGLADAITVSTRQYAKRQLVWIRGQAPAEAVDADDVGGAYERAVRLFDRVAKRQGIG